MPVLNALGHISSPMGLVLLISRVVGAVCGQRAIFLKIWSCYPPAPSPSGVSHFTWNKIQSPLLTSKATWSPSAAGHGVPKSQTLHLQLNNSKDHHQAASSVDDFTAPSLASRRLVSPEKRSPALGPLLLFPLLPDFCFSFHFTNC